MTYVHFRNIYHLYHTYSLLLFILRFKMTQNFKEVLYFFVSRIFSVVFKCFIFLIWLMVYRRGRGDPERQMTVLNLSIKCLQKIYSLYLLFCVQITVTTILSNYLTPHLFSISLKILPIFQLQQRSKGF